MFKQTSTWSSDWCTSHE